MMKILRNSGFGLMIFLAFVLLGCTQPIRNVTDAPVTVNKTNVTLDDVHNAIKRAGVVLGWAMKEESPGKMTGTLNLRSHVAVVGITYDTKTYTINYMNSTNLQYDEKKATIHKNYNGWIQNLDNAIRVNLANL